MDTGTATRYGDSGDAMDSWQATTRRISGLGGDGTGEDKDGYPVDADLTDEYSAGGQPMA